jgi:hypothetical protein
MGFLDAFKAKSSKVDVPGENTEQKPEHKNVAPKHDTHSQSDQTSKPSSEKESTLVDEPLRNSSANDDTDKELASTRTPVHNAEMNGDSTQELAPKGTFDKPTEDEKKEDSDAETPREEEEYPNAWRLTLISIALCLCVFCVALVCTASLLNLIISS